VNDRVTVILIRPPGEEGIVIEADVESTEDRDEHHERGNSAESRPEC
jgi:hypothetical protein